MSSPVVEQNGGKIAPCTSLQCSSFNVQRSALSGYLRQKVGCIAEGRLLNVVTYEKNSVFFFAIRQIFITFAPR